MSADVDLKTVYQPHPSRKAGLVKIYDSDGKLSQELDIEMDDKNINISSKTNSTSLGQEGVTKSSVEKQMIDKHFSGNSEASGSNPNLTRVERVNKTQILEPTNSFEENLKGKMKASDLTSPELENTSESWSLFGWFKPMLLGLHKITGDYFKMRTIIPGTGDAVQVAGSMTPKIEIEYNSPENIDGESHYKFPSITDHPDMNRHRYNPYLELAACKPGEGKLSTYNKFLGSLCDAHREFCNNSSYNTITLVLMTNFQEDFCTRVRDAVSDLIDTEPNISQSKLLHEITVLFEEFVRNNNQLLDHNLNEENELIFTAYSNLKTLFLNSIHNYK